ncbi:MAG: hypothetical protein HS122_06270 [Opitutaceae bacterium]|nr:hypothetical protein [Opitutaceae bacterium]
MRSFSPLPPVYLGYDVTVTGATTGIVWGTGVYTHDSNIATAAVHAGPSHPARLL